ncbi:GNAT family N-acetyltransferase [Kurthia sibirica]|uniref:GNAT family N-acetyltransferase n=1 Tax=Kurthia sibirica TaxID=202750 RepID=A0A2U3AJ89_9BACL|nr:GNAT family N-acetyltransferase [Kurthia sibirica]PWI24541.1 GNAT family N-acetyltransferase [Kurthia sibirica]GEK33610.1 N-acetyltransferase [Kurthia sibirica]
MFPTISTERLNLRELQPEDALDVLTCFSNEDVLRYYGQRPLTSMEQVKDILVNFATDFKRKKGVKWGIEVHGQHRIIGTIGFQEWSLEHKRADISYALFPEFWGEGYANEAVKAAINYGFDEMELTRIGAIVLVGNEASSHILKKQGFQLEGILQNYMYQNDQPFDAEIYAITT